jgi:hypothetical protein
VTKSFQSDAYPRTVFLAEDLVDGELRARRPQNGLLDLG